MTNVERYPPGTLLMVMFGSRGSQIARVRHWLDETRVVVVKWRAKNNTWTFPRAIDSGQILGSLASHCPPRTRRAWQRAQREASLRKESR